MSKNQDFSNYFSIIIPLYNKVEYIERAVNSILSQTYQNFEIIIINDGSTDGSTLKVESILDNRIILLNQRNLGVSVARNNGAKNAKYNLLAFLDADDIWDCTFLYNLNLLVNKYPKAGIYGTNNYFEYPNGKLFYEKYNWLFGNEKSGLIKDYFSVFAKSRKSAFSNSNLCIPTKIYQEFGGYKEGVKLTEDSDLWCRIALKYDIAYLTTPLATYYIGVSGGSHVLFEPYDFQVSLTLQNALKEKTVSPKYINSVKKLITFHRLSLIKRSILTGNKLFALKKIFSFNLLFIYPISTILCVVTLLIPKSLFNYYHKKKYS